MDPMMMMMLMSLSGAAMQGGNKGEFKSNYNPNQLNTLDNILQQIKSMKGGQDITQNPNYQSGANWLQDLYNDENFYKNFEAPLQRQFQEETVPGLANRFSGMGSGGSLGSTAFRNQLAREGSNLSTNISALRGGMQQQGVNQSLGYAQAPVNQYMQLLQQALNPTQTAYMPPSQGFFGPILGSLAGGAASGYGQQWGQNMAMK
jgi:hypothetical protein